MAINLIKLAGGRKLFALCAAVAIYVFVPALGKAQNTGRIECARSGDYVYLYSSVATLDVRATLQCGEVVQITSRYDNFFGVRTAKNETGFVAFASILLLKDQPGTGLPAPSSDPPGRERMYYDSPPHAAPAPVRPPVPPFTLLKDTPIRVKLLKTISSATAHIGDPVELVVLDDLFVEGVRVLSKGTTVSGLVAEAEPKKRFGHNGRVAFTITSIVLADGEKAPVRCYEEASGTSDVPSGALVPLNSGKDVALLQDTEFTALVDGDFPLKHASFMTLKDAATAVPATPAPTTPVQTPQPKP